MLSRPPRLPEIKIRLLLYSIHDCPLKHTEAQSLVEDVLTWQQTPDLWTNLRDWACERMFASLKIWNLKFCM